MNGLANIRVQSRLTELERLATTATRLRDIQAALMPDSFDMTEWQHPDQLMARDCAEYDRLLDVALAQANLSGREMTKLRVALGLENSRLLPDTLLAANLHVRRQAYRSLFKAVRAGWDAGVPSHRRWFFVTLITDIGNALEYDTVVEFGRTKRDTSRILAGTGLHALGMLEVQAATNYPQGGHGCSLELHGHYLGYTDDPGFRPQATAKRLCRRDVLSNWLSAPTIAIKPVSSIGRLMDVCRYVSKPPVKGHYLQPDNRKDSGYTRQSTNVTASVALRLAEVLSHFTVVDLASATGKGGLALKRVWRGDLQTWHNRHRNVVPVDAPALIQKIWASDRTSMQRLPMQIRRNAQSPQCDKWRAAMAVLFGKVAEYRAAHGGTAPD